MLTGQVLASLRRVIEAGADESRALRDVRLVDPLLRPWARARLNRALRRELTDMGTDVDGEATDLLLRRVYLRLAGWPAGPDEPAAQVTARYARQAGWRSRRPPRGWWLTGAMGVLGLCGALLVLTHVIRSPPAVTPVARVPPLPAGAYARGGVPCRQVPRIRRALGEDLASWVVALDRLHQPGLADRQALRRRLAQARRRVLPPEVRQALGRRLAQDLDSLMRAAERVASPRASDVAVPAFLQAVVAVNEDLAARNLGFYLDGDVLESFTHRSVFVSVFEVQRVARYEHASGVERVLYLRRLDRLNLRHDLLGFTRPAHREALVLTAEVESVLLRDLLPALANREMSLVDDATARWAPPWSAAVARRAGTVVRAELAALPGLARGRVAALARLVEQRRRLFSRWQARLSRQGIRVQPPEGLVPLPEDRELLGHLVPRRELRRLDYLQARLKNPRAQQTLTALGRMLSASVARHELQHRLDYRRQRRARLPEPYESLIGPLRDRRGRVRRWALRARHELSAYLAELARDPRLPRTSLSLLTRYVLDHDFRGRPEARAARVLLVGLDDLLNPGLPAARPARRLAIDRRDLAVRYLRLSATPPALLRRMAARLWKRLFGEALVALRRLPASRIAGGPGSAARCPVDAALPPEADEPGPAPSPPFGGLFDPPDRVLIRKLGSELASRS